ncbi:MAG: hypothetical protein KGJ66_02835 [Alphaproteobacteria bacterium]|nr:hypothetical protein [Alphaproteobacteria bacterium]
MAEYKCYLLNRDNRILRREDVEADTLPNAVQRGHALIEAQRERFDGFEIWHGAERLHVFRRTAALTTR